MPTELTEAIVTGYTDYRDDDYEAFMQQHNISGQFSTFIQRHVGKSVPFGSFADFLHCS